VSRDYSSSPKTNLRAVRGVACAIPGAPPAFYSFVGDISGARTKTIFACDRPPSSISMHELVLQPTPSVASFRAVWNVTDRSSLQAANFYFAQRVT